mmetsp:Transcript_28539/g.65268  ORF Transcript_28539/g.65268 Transcript_28539/m.65268 type:complete len:421 (-) Transcript_28539:205-1467(-)
MSDEESPPTPIVSKKDKNVIPSASADSQAKHPDMSLAQSIHRLLMIRQGHLPPSSYDVPALRRSVVDAAVSDSNPSLYRHVASLLDWRDSDPGSPSPAALSALDSANAATKADLEAAVTAARDSAGDAEVLAASLAVARYAARSEPYAPAAAAYDAVLALPKIGGGRKIDAWIEEARVADFHGETRAAARAVEEATKAAEAGGDWDRRNRLKVYGALSKLKGRDIKGAAALLIECIATFSCVELCSYTDFVLYTVVSNVLHLPRTDLKAKIIDGPEVVSVQSEIPAVFDLVRSLHDCDYRGYLKAVVELHPLLVADRYLQRHAGYIVRELHVLGYKQFLDSYKSVTLESMAGSFGVGAEFLDLQLSRFIAAGRLTAKIDKFGGVVETNRPDMKNAQYRDMIQKGDLLLNRIQKLTRVVDM